MATLNPLEKKARSSFIKGLVVAGIIGALIIAALIMLIFKMNGEEKQRIAAQKQVVILTSDIKSGEEVTADLVTTELANSEVASSGALSMSDFNALSTITDEAGNLIAIKLIAKIDIPAKTILTQEMISAEDETVSNDLREQEFNMIVLPATLQDGDTIDVRLRLPTGEDFLVISKKRVKLSDLGGTYSPQSIILNVTEEEILTMSAAIVDAYQMEGSKLSATKYTDPGLQEKATPTYVPSNSTINLINTDPNIVATARNSLITRYNNTYNQYRAGIEGILSITDESTRQSGIQTATGTETATQQSERQTYLEQMAGE